MSVVELKHQIGQLSKSEQDEIFAWLAKRKEVRDEDYLDHVTALIDDKDRSNWMTEDEFSRLMKDD